MISMSLALRNARLQAIVDALDKGARPAVLKMYDGKRPRTGGPGSTLLAEISLSRPCGYVDGGTLTMGAFGKAKGLAMGIASWARFESGRGEAVLDASVGLEDADILMVGSCAIATGQPVEIETAEFTEPGA
jgi:hypothetical protein